MFIQRRFWHGLIIALLSLAWFTIIVKALFAYFGNTAPLGALEFMGQDRMLTHAGEIISYFFRHPVEILQRCFSAAKLDYSLRLFLPLGFLSLASPAELMIGLPVFLQNFLLSQRLTGVESPRYTMTALPFIFIAAIYSAAYISKKFKSRWEYILILVLACWSLSVYRFIRDPDYNPRFMQISAPISKETLIHRQALRMVVRLVPKNASVSADLRALPFLADHSELYDIPIRIAEVEYILIDKKEPSISPRVVMPKEEYLKVVEQFLTSPGYTLIENLDGIILLKKGK